MRKLRLTYYSALTTDSKLVDCQRKDRIDQVSSQIEMLKKDGLQARLADYSIFLGEFSDKHHPLIDRKVHDILRPVQVCWKHAINDPFSNRIQTKLSDYKITCEYASLRIYDNGIVVPSMTYSIEHKEKESFGLECLAKDIWILGDQKDDFELEIHSTLIRTLNTCNMNNSYTKVSWLVAIVQIIDDKDYSKDDTEKILAPFFSISDDFINSTINWGEDIWEYTSHDWAVLLHKPDEKRVNSIIELEYIGAFDYQSLWYYHYKSIELSDSFEFNRKSVLGLEEKIKRFRHDVNTHMNVMNFNLMSESQETLEFFKIYRNSHDRHEIVKDVQNSLEYLYQMFMQRYSEIERSNDIMLNKIILFFTAITISGVACQVISTIDFNAKFLDVLSRLLIVSGITIVLIMLFVRILTKWTRNKD